MNKSPTMMCLARTKTNKTTTKIMYRRNTFLVWIGAPWGTAVYNGWLSVYPLSTSEGTPTEEHEKSGLRRIWYFCHTCWLCPCPHWFRLLGSKWQHSTVMFLRRWSVIFHQTEPEIYWKTAVHLFTPSFLLTGPGWCFLIVVPFKQ